MTADQREKEYGNMADLFCSICNCMIKRNPNLSANWFYVNGDGGITFSVTPQDSDMEPDTWDVQLIEHNRKWPTIEEMVDELRSCLTDEEFLFEGDCENEDYNAYVTDICTKAAENLSYYFDN